MQSPVSLAEPSRHGDQMLTTYLAATGRKSPQFLESINRCRLYLQVSTLADLVTVDGRSVRQRIWQGQQNFSRGHRHDWPMQGQPGQDNWSDWREMLRQLFGLIGNSRRLAVPIGRWTDSWQDWRWFQSQEGSLVYRSQDGELYEYYQHRGGASYTRANRRIAFIRFAQLAPFHRVDVDNSRSSWLTSGERRQHSIDPIRTSARITGQLTHEAWRNTLCHGL